MKSSVRYACSGYRTRLKFLEKKFNVILSYHILIATFVLEAIYWRTCEKVMHMYILENM